MKIKNLYTNTKKYIISKKETIIVISLIFTMMFSLYNRIIGAINESLWHESISIYYFSLVLIKSIIYVYLKKRKSNKNDILIFKITKTLLLILNILLIVPITLLILNKRTIEISLIFSIVVALYVTIKTTKTIINYVKYKNTNNILLNELKTIELTDVVVSILTLQNTLITINSNDFDLKLFYLTIITSCIGFLLNIFLIFKMKIKK